MSNSDSFIDEVSEEVRRDRFFGLLKKYGWIAALAVVAIVGGTAWNEWRKASAAAEAERVGGALLDALESPDTALADLEAIQTESDARAITGLLTAAVQAEDGDIEAAAATLDALAGDEDLPELYRELATLKSLMLPLEGRDMDARRTALEAMAIPGKPFRMIALELLAMQDAADGKTDAAIEQFQFIAQDAEATAGMRDRAIEMIVYLGGEPEGFQ